MDAFHLALIAAMVELTMFAWLLRIAVQQVRFHRDRSRRR